MSVLRPQDHDILAGIRWSQEEQDGYPTIEEIVERAVIIDRERIAQAIEAQVGDRFWAAVPCSAQGILGAWVASSARIARGADVWDCFVCGGKFPTDHTHTECADCHGTGHRIGSRYKCPSCGGKGYVA